MSARCSRSTPNTFLLPREWRRRCFGASDDKVRERLGPFASRIETTVRSVDFDYPFPPADVVQYFREYFGPTKTAFARLDPAGQEALAADAEALWREHNRDTAGRTLVPAEYLEVVATRA